MLKCPFFALKKELIAAFKKNKNILSFRYKIQSQNGEIYTSMKSINLSWHVPLLLL